MVKSLLGCPFHVWNCKLMGDVWIKKPRNTYSLVHWAQIKFWMRTVLSQRRLDATISFYVSPLQNWKDLVAMVVPGFQRVPYQCQTFVASKAPVFWRPTSPFGWKAAACSLLGPCWKRKKDCDGSRCHPQFHRHSGQAPLDLRHFPRPGSDWGCRRICAW